MPCKHSRQVYQQVAIRGKRKGSLLHSTTACNSRQSRKAMVQWSSPGKNTLHARLKNMCKAAGISVHKTNHSLRATTATEMFRSGAPEKLIQECTGHRSLEALCCYERLDEAQHRAVSSLLSLKCTSKAINVLQGAYHEIH